jgi:hypothetical protein
VLVRIARWGAAAVLVLSLGCGQPSRQVPGEAAGENRGGWAERPLTGIPAEAELWDVAVREGIFVASGELPGSESDDSMMGLWRSTDGVSWTEVHRERYLRGGDGPPDAQVSSGPSGFAVVGASCESHCQPLALTSADGRAWSPGDVRRRTDLRGATSARLLRGTPSVAYEGAALLDVIDSGGWMAVGWMQAGSYDAEPAVWRTRDAGATWEPIPPEAIPKGGDRADHMERVIVWSGRLLASGLSHVESGAISDRLWVSAGANEWRSIPVPAPTWRLREMASIRSGGAFRAFLAGNATETEAAVWRSEKEGEWQRLDDPALTKLRLVSGLKAGPTGLVLLGSEQEQHALWGSPDGIHWLQTLRLGRRPAGWSTAIATKDRWFVYGTTGKGPAGEGGRQVVWTTKPRCATGASLCP